MADVNVDEVDIGKIREGMSAEITADSLLGITLKGRVRRIWPVVKSDANGRVCKVRIDVSVGNNKVLTGASCMARITSRLRDDTLIIPAAALIPGAKPAAVWVAVEDTSAAGEQPAEGTGEGKSEKQGETPSPEVPARKLYKAERREIELGASTVSSVEVLSGLSQGDLVAVDLIPQITEGIKVRNGSR
jgi:HlyD family secretion protein